MELVVFNEVKRKAPPQRSDKYALTGLGIGQQLRGDIRVGSKEGGEVIIDGTNGRIIVTDGVTNRIVIGNV